MKHIKQGHYTGERPLFSERELFIEDTVFTDGESPLKESADIRLENCVFEWKYPLWYAKRIRARDCTWLEAARAGVWYTEDVALERCQVEAPKNFRRCNGVTLRDVSFPHGEETLWNCKDVLLERIVARGDYFAMNCEDLHADGLVLYGNYPFDGVKNAEIRRSRLLSKDAFWNCENVTVYDSFISGEYLGWNSKNLTFVNCTIESLQGLCYIENLVLKNCKLLNTTLAFEYSTVEADVCGTIDSVLNPSGGKIAADSIGELTLQEDRIDPSATAIVCRNKEEG